MARLHILALGMLFLLCSCSTNSELYLRDELANRGPQALSPTNPFLSTNLFIAKEMKNSEVFRGFIRYKGTPDAVEVRKSYFKPIRVYLFYLSDGEAFLLEQASDDWLVRGPDKIPAQLMSAFFNMTPAGPNAPLALDGEGPVFAAGEATSPVRPAYVDPAPEVKSLRKVPTRDEVIAQNTKPKRPPVKAERTATATIEEDLGTVKESSSGDLIHRVTFNGETLRMIAKWYTGDINNTGRIARINGIERPDVLTIDQSIRIPRYLLKTTRPLPQSEVAKFSAEGTE
jgi:hypothetical protein